MLFQHVITIRIIEIFYIFFFLKLTSVEEKTSVYCDYSSYVYHIERVVCKHVMTKVI